MAQNPYQLTFGKEPAQFISRASQMADVLEAFEGDPAVQQIYLITGVRGTGKTVFMTETAKELKERKEWIVVELNSSDDLLSDLAAILSSEDRFARIFQRAKINLSFFGLGLEVKGCVPITSIQVALGKMLESLKKSGKRVLICIDEVSVTDSMKKFAGAFQIFVRQDLPVYLLMTGLYQNINDLQNEDNLTFLYRAPRIDLKPLNISNIAGNYRKTLGIDQEKALKMARITRGYSFAFQVLGYYTWKHKGDYEAAIDEARQYLEDYVYEKIWSEMSAGDRRLAYGTAKAPTGRASEIKTILSISNSEYTPYRDRLIKRGILNGSEHGYLHFALPMFEDYVLVNYEEQ